MLIGLWNQRSHHPGGVVAGTEEMRCGLFPPAWMRTTVQARTLISSSTSTATRRRGLMPSLRRGCPDQARRFQRQHVRQYCDESPGDHLCRTAWPGTDSKLHHSVTHDHDMIVIMPSDPGGPGASRSLSRPGGGAPCETAVSAAAAAPEL